MSEEEKEFRERLSNDIGTMKKMLFTEEAISAVLAIVFGANVACMVMFPFSIFSVLNLVACFVVAKRFRFTVKKQIVFAAHLKLLKTIKNEKVWTQGDK